MHFSAAALLFAVLPAAVVQSHGNIMEPAAVWTKGYPMTGFSSTVDNLLWGPMDGTTYGYGPEGAVKYWTANFPKSPYKSLKEFILAKHVMGTDSGDKECGYTLKDEAKREALPAAIKHSGFFHPGPCEAWCDSNKIAYDVDCNSKYPTGVIPIDASKCTGADRLSLYWLAVHGAPWQVYSDCVWLKGGKSTGTTPSVTTAAPKATTVAPKATTSTPAPKATTLAPASGASTPSPQQPTADGRLLTDCAASLPRSSSQRALRGAYMLEPGSLVGRHFGAGPRQTSVSNLPRRGRAPSRLRGCRRR